jgi:hypothetical protein
MGDTYENETGAEAGRAQQMASSTPVPPRTAACDDFGLVAENESPDTLDLLKLNTIHSAAEVPFL